MAGNASYHGYHMCMRFPDIKWWFCDYCVFVPACVACTLYIMNVYFCDGNQKIYAIKFEKVELY